METKRAKETEKPENGAATSTQKKPFAPDFARVPGVDVNPYSCRSCKCHPGSK